MRAHTGYVRFFILAASVAAVFALCVYRAEAVATAGSDLKTTPASPAASPINVAEKSDKKCAATGKNDPDTGYPATYTCNWKNLNTIGAGGKLTVQQCENKKPCDYSKTENGVKILVKAQCVSPGECKAISASDTTGKQEGLSKPDLSKWEPPAQTPEQKKAIEDNWKNLDQASQGKDMTKPQIIEGTAKPVQYLTPEQSAASQSMEDALQGKNTGTVRPYEGIGVQAMEQLLAGINTDIADVAPSAVEGPAMEGNVGSVAAPPENAPAGPGVEGSGPPAPGQQPQDLTRGTGNTLSTGGQSNAETDAVEKANQVACNLGYVQCKMQEITKAGGDLVTKVENSLASTWGSVKQALGWPAPSSDVVATDQPSATPPATTPPATTPVAPTSIETITNCWEGSCTPTTGTEFNAWDTKWVSPQGPGTVGPLDGVNIGIVSSAEAAPVGFENTQEYKDFTAAVGRPPQNAAEVAQWQSGSSMVRTQVAPGQQTISDAGPTGRTDSSFAAAAPGAPKATEIIKSTAPTGEVQAPNPETKVIQSPLKGSSDNAGTLPNAQSPAPVSGVRTPEPTTNPGSGQATAIAKSADNAGVLSTNGPSQPLARASDVASPLPGSGAGTAARAGASAGVMAGQSPAVPGSYASGKSQPQVSIAPSAQPYSKPTLVVQSPTASQSPTYSQSRPSFSISVWIPSDTYVTVVQNPAPSNTGSNSQSQQTQQQTAVQNGGIAACPPNLPCANIPIVYLPAASTTPVTYATSSVNSSSNTFNSSLSSTLDSLQKAIMKALGLVSSGTNSQGVVTLVANPTRVTSGNTTQLQWISTDTKSCIVRGTYGMQVASGGPDGMAVSPPIITTTTFKITCETLEGKDVTGQQTVTVE